MRLRGVRLVDIATAERLGEACVIFSGVDTCDNFVAADVKRVSAARWACAARMRWSGCGDESRALLGGPDDGVVGRCMCAQVAPTHARGRSMHTPGSRPLFSP